MTTNYQLDIAILHAKQSSWHEKRLVRYASDLEYADILILEASGLLVRKNYPNVHNHTDYFLTDRGQIVVDPD